MPRTLAGVDYADPEGLRTKLMEVSARIDATARPVVRDLVLASKLALRLYDLTRPIPPNELAANYRAVHQRLKRHRGRAYEYRCIECGEQAQEWAYNNSGVDELTERIPDRYRPGSHSKVRFSTDLNQYQPMCKRCHRRMDSAARGGRNTKRKASQCLGRAI